MCYWKYDQLNEIYEVFIFIFVRFLFLIKIYLRESNKFSFKCHKVSLGRIDRSSLRQIKEYSNQCCYGAILFIEYLA